jgi:hypothetical protein
MHVSVPKWTIPLTFVGLGGLSAMLFSERGRRLIRSAEKRCSSLPGRVVAWNESAKRELDHIQQALKELEQSLGTTTVR